MLMGQGGRDEPRSDPAVSRQPVHAFNRIDQQKSTKAYRDRDDAGKAMA
jgi:hypothetical protein